jgi:5-methylcytosine-specific restriction endonuclease McrA
MASDRSDPGCLVLVLGIIAIFYGIPTLWRTYGWGFAFPVIALIGVAILVTVKVLSQRKKESEKLEFRLEQDFQHQKSEFESSLKHLSSLKENVESIISEEFAIPTCSKCNDVVFNPLNLNSLGNGIQLRCNTCGRETWISADAPNLEDLIVRFTEYHELLDTLEHSRFVTVLHHHRPQVIELAVNSRVDLQKDASKHRSSIPSKVKQEVWQRDNGKCVNCGSNVNLEYDHIIPVSKGGANTTRNIQLLCESCNRSKGAKIE